MRSRPPVAVRGPFLEINVSWMQFPVPGLENTAIEGYLEQIGLVFSKKQRPVEMWTARGTPMHYCWIIVCFWSICWGKVWGPNGHFRVDRLLGPLLLGRAQHHRIGCAWRLEAWGKRRTSEIMLVNLCADFKLKSFFYSLKVIYLERRQKHSSNKVWFHLINRIRPAAGRVGSFARSPRY